jgi:23S rRNA pseudouridine1911/1915/1917 synthase
MGAKLLTRSPLDAGSIFMKSSAERSMNMSCKVPTLRKREFMRYTVQEKMPLLQFFETHCQGMSKTTIKQWIGSERVLINEAPVDTIETTLSPGDIVSVGHKMHYEKEISVVYEDHDIVVVDKPRGLLSVASDFEEVNTLHHKMKRRYAPNKVYVVHRLDQETSGLILFALSEKAYTRLKAALFHHQVERKYLALVPAGTLSGKGTWTTYLYEDRAFFVHGAENPECAERAVTHYEVIEENKHYAAGLFMLETGKKNQIRAQAAHFKAPLIGDQKYGGKKARRLFLHALSLSFVHPIRDKKVTFTSPVPKEFRTLITLPDL